LRPFRDGMRVAWKMVRARSSTVMAEDTGENGRIRDGKASGNRKSDWRIANWS
jgi:hypothetical protein